MVHVYFAINLVTQDVLRVDLAIIWQQLDHAQNAFLLVQHALETQIIVSHIKMVQSL